MSRKELNYHILGWSLYLLYIIVGYLIYHEPFKRQIWTYSITFVKIIEFYILYLIIYPRYLAKGRMFLLTGGILAAMFSFVLIRYILEEVVFNVLFHIQNYFGYTALSYTLDNLYFSSSAVLLSLAAYGSFDSLRKERENKSLKEEKVQAELTFLKSQINPHFLYNTLNYIYSLAYSTSEQLASAVMTLSNLMRYMLTESNGHKVNLQDEVDYIKNFISIYQMRFENSFFVNFDQRGNIDGKMVASLLLVPFVENAFKHGVVNDPERPITIDLSEAGNEISFLVTNHINQQQKDHSTGIGLPNIKRRLALIYPHKHNLTLYDNGKIFKTILKISL